MRRDEERGYLKLSPFELKHRLAQLARSRGERLMLNAARGNPNWVALTARRAFFDLGGFAVEESIRTALDEGFGGPPEIAGIGERFVDWLEKHPASEGFLLESLTYAADHLELNRDGLLREWVDAVLGDHYPTPGRFLPGCEAIVRAALVQDVFRGARTGDLDLFATEGASAAIRYVFDSLKHSQLLNRGERIALGVPIFTPYIEVPRLHDYDLVEVQVRQDEAGGWQYPRTELEKLLDPRVKAFLVVNPSNPTSVAIHPESVERIASLVRARRPDLILITDDVYATFPETYLSLAARAPRNTILIYSWSKAWGVTGWRLGAVAIHADNVLDERIAAMPEAVRAQSAARYASLSREPERLRFIDRMLADSRAVGLNHTAGLSTPQQVQMALLCLQSLLDITGDTRRAVRNVVRRRHRELCAAAGVEFPEDPACAHYYATLDIPEIATRRHGAAFGRWLVDSHEPIDFVIRLAEEKGVVLMDGGGFEAPRMSVRVSLANLADADYERIGRAVSDLLDEYHARFVAEHPA